MLLPEEVKGQPRGCLFPLSLRLLSLHHLHHLLHLHHMLTCLLRVAFVVWGDEVRAEGDGVGDRVT